MLGWWKSAWFHVVPTPRKRLWLGVSYLQAAGYLQGYYFDEKPLSVYSKTISAFVTRSSCPLVSAKPHAPPVGKIKATHEADQPALGRVIERGCVEHHRLLMVRVQVAHGVALEEPLPQVLALVYALPAVRTLREYPSDNITAAMHQMCTTKT
jgi:hypothetical protein